MANGLLEVTGTLNVEQFWPGGESDGDTAKVVVKRGAFRFRAKPSARWKVTRAFDEAVVKKTERSPTGSPAVDTHSRVTVRWQGMDAPELHYRPTVQKLDAKQKTALKAVNANFRQCLGESATRALAKYLEKLGKGRGTGPIPVTVRTAVDDPSEAFDVYGRLIANIYVKVGGREVDLNLWMVENGWAFPTLYASMSKEEMEDVLRRAKEAKAKGRGIWKHASASLATFDAKLRFRKGGTVDAKRDAGPVVMPKLFRRLSTFSVEKKARIASGAFREFLQAAPDACFETNEFLSQGVAAARHRRLDEFVTKGAVFTVGAGDVVFQEKGSVVVGRDGRVAEW